MKIKLTTAAAAALLLATASTSMYASTVTMNLGVSTQNFILTGLGPRGNGNGGYSMTQGSCVNGATLTTCTLSGAITSSSNPGFASGTYAFITTYKTTDVLPIQGESSNPTSNSFFYDFFASDVNMTLDLNGTPTGNYVEPLVTNGAFVPGIGFGFAYTTLACAGLPAATPCSQANVGQFAGATTTGPTTISASFLIPDVVSAPEPASILLTLAGGASLLYFRNRRKLSTDGTK